MDKIRVDNSIKLQEDEVKELEQFQRKITEAIFNLGRFELEKSNVLAELNELNNDQNKLAAKLQEKYGEGSINLQKGTITVNPPPESE